MIRPFNPITYIRYLCASNEQRTAQIFDLLRGDEVCARILDDLESYGFEISYPFFGSSGEYRPVTLAVTGEQYEAEFLKRFAHGEFKAKFSMSSRYGIGQNAFYFIHELIHFAQDMDGRLQSDDVLALECEAAVQSIKAAYLIGGIVWEGALSSLDWGSLARSYAKDQDLKELEQRWHKSAQKRYYERKASSKSENISPVHLWNNLRSIQNSTNR